VSQIVNTAQNPIARDARAVPLRVPPQPATSTTHSQFVALADIPADQWQALSQQASEPSGFSLPDWEGAVDALSQGRSCVSALAAWAPVSGQPTLQLIGLIPTVSAWRAYRLPLPALATADPYAPLATLLLDRDHADEAVAALLHQARNTGAHALILRDVPMNGAAMNAFDRVLAAQGLRPRVLQSHQRACLDATCEADGLLRDALGAKKFKELRRQRNRLAEHGQVTFTVAKTPQDAARALEIFLALEASGWKAQRGTSILQDESNSAFIRRAVPRLAARRQCEIIMLHAGETPVAAGIVLRHLNRAFYFKMGVDESFAKWSPGVQLTLELTRHLCADPVIASADSTAAPNHPMIDPIWRGRIEIGDVLIPLRARDPLITAIHAMLALRRAARIPARWAVHALRDLREKRS